MTDHPPIHSAKGVEYWDETLQEYILDAAPHPNTIPIENRIREPWMGPLPSGEGDTNDETINDEQG